MFSPGRELTEKYAATVVTATEPRYRATQELIRDYVLKNFHTDSDGNRVRVLMLVFKGKNAVEKIRETVGHIVNERTTGETIRDTYGDYVVDKEGKVIYFEPAVLTSPDAVTAAANLKLWASYSDTDGGLLENVVSYADEAHIQKTLVLIKPDNFKFPNARPGGVIDLFSRTGLSIIGVKVHRMSVAQAEEFYRPVLEVLQDKLQEPTGARARLAIEGELGLPLNDEIQKDLGELLGPIAGRQHWEAIVQFMAGMRPSQCPPGQREEDGTEKCVALVYQGVDAVRKIREVLGPTDPSKAPPGSIRREFGQTIMVNAAHASDSPDNAAREMEIVQILENNFKSVIEAATK